MKAPQTLIEKVLENARWAPSGDNMQPWRFEIIDEKHFIVHGYDTREHCVYDLQGHASQLAIGALLESIAIAASEFKHHAKFTLRQNTPETKPTIDVILTSDDSMLSDPLFEFLPIRSVQRRALKTIPLTLSQKKLLQQSIGNFYHIKWIEGYKLRWQAAWLMFKSGQIRLNLPEAYHTHSTIIEWDARFSDDKIPDQAIGLDSFTLKLMRWAIKSWQRVKFLNTYCFGTLLPRIELDLIPGIYCAAHFALIANENPQTIQDYINAGRAIQRFWLTCTQQSLQLQPEMTPLIFSEYIRNELKFTVNKKLLNDAGNLSLDLISLLEFSDITKIMFIGRVGSGKTSFSRSLRLSTKQLEKTT